MIRKTVDISLLKPNKDNPRIIKDRQFRELVESIISFPEMLETREIVVNKDYVILGGNMRYHACLDAGLKEVPVKIVDFSEDKQKEFIIKDNIEKGEWDWDRLANEWEEAKLNDWGLLLPTIDDEIDNAEEDETIEFEKSVQIEPTDEYIVIKAGANSVEWEDLKEKLKLKVVRRGGYRKGSSFGNTTGIERVLTWYDLKDRLGAGDDHSSTEQE